MDLISLPDDLIVQVFSCLGFLDKISLSTVNKKLYSVLKGRKAWGEARLAVRPESTASVFNWLNSHWQVIWRGGRLFNCMSSKLPLTAGMWKLEGACFFRLLSGSYFLHGLLEVINSYSGQCVQFGLCRTSRTSQSAFLPAMVEMWYQPCQAMARQPSADLNSAAIRITLRFGLWRVLMGFQQWSIFPSGNLGFPASRRASRPSQLSHCGCPTPPFNLWPQH